MPQIDNTKAFELLTKMFNSGNMDCKIYTDKEIYTILTINSSKKKFQVTTHFNGSAVIPVTNKFSDLTNLFNDYKIKDIVVTNPYHKFMEEKCAICLEKYTNDEILTKLSCGHVFHYHCILNNINYDNLLCPACRAVYNKAEVKIFNLNKQIYSFDSPPNGFGKRKKNNLDKEIKYLKSLIPS